MFSFLLLLLAQGHLILLSLAIRDDFNLLPINLPPFFIWEEYVPRS